MLRTVTRASRPEPAAEPAPTAAPAPPRGGVLDPALERPGVVHGLLVVGVVAVSFAAVLIRVAEAPALAIAAWRCAGGAVALLPFALRHQAPSAKQARVLLASGAFLAVHFGLFVGALQQTTVASAVALASTAPVFVGLGAAVVLRDPPGRRTWAGMALAVAGAATLAIGDASAGVVPTAPRPLLGDAMALGSAAAVAGYLVLGQRARRSLPVTTYGAGVYGTAAVLLVLAALLLRAPLGGFDAGTWWALLGLVVGPQLLGHTVFNQVLSAVPATTVAALVLVEPVAGGLLAFALLGEVPPALLAVGGPLTLAGVYLAATGEARGGVEDPGYAPPP